MLNKTLMLTYHAYVYNKQKAIKVTKMTTVIMVIDCKTMSTQNQLSYLYTEQGKQNTYVPHQQKT